MFRRGLIWIWYLSANGGAIRHGVSPCFRIACTQAGAALTAALATTDRGDQAFAA
jgi:hypothetical protein